MHRQKLMQAILITRLSTEEQREAGNSLPAQVTRLERYGVRYPDLEIFKKHTVIDSL
jgi:hypothetical protein